MTARWPRVRKAAGVRVDMATGTVVGEIGFMFERAIVRSVKFSNPYNVDLSIFGIEFAEGAF